MAEVEGTASGAAQPAWAAGAPVAPSLPLTGIARCVATLAGGETAGTASVGARRRRPGTTGRSNREVEGTASGAAQPAWAAGARVAQPSLTGITRCVATLASGVAARCGWSVVGLPAPVWGAALFISCERPSNSPASVIERHGSLLGLEAVLLLDGHPRQLATPARQLIAAARQLLLVAQKRAVAQTQRLTPSRSIVLVSSFPALSLARTTK